MKKLENREVKRHPLLSELDVVYEGSTEVIPVRLPDLSTSGMFIPTQSLFPIGSVLKVSFWLPRSRFQVNARAEVRHIVPNSGIGVEFVRLSSEALLAIEEEFRE
jgi:hypothetical protein